VSPGSLVGEYPPREEPPKSPLARRRPGEDAPSDSHEICDRNITCPRQGPRGDTHASPSFFVRSLQTLRKPRSDTLKGPSEDPLLTDMGPVSAENGRSFVHRHALGLEKGATWHPCGAPVSGARCNTGKWSKSGSHQIRPLTGGLPGEFLVPGKSRDLCCGW